MLKYIIMYPEEIIEPKPLLPEEQTHQVSPPPPPPPPSQQSTPQQGIPKLRTFRSDAEIYMHENQVSRLEMDTKNYVSQTAARWQVPSINYKLYAYILGGIAILAGAGYLGYQYYPGTLTEPTDSVAKHKPHAPFLQVEEETELLFSKADGGSLAAAIRATLGRQFKYGSINYLKIRTSENQPYTTSGEFIKAMQWNPPEAFAANIEPEFNAVVVYETPVNSPVFIFKSKNFTKTFAALLEWENGAGGEKSSMWQDLKAFIDLENIASKDLYQKTFDDDLIKNNDARAFRTPDGRLLFEYALFSKKFIVMSPSREALSLVLTRMIALPPQ